MADRTVKVKLTGDVKDYTASVDKAAAETDKLKAKADEFSDGKYDADFGANTKSASTNIDGLKEKAESFSKSTYDAQVTASTKDARTEIDDLRTELADFDGKTYQAVIKAKADQAKADLREITAELDEVGSKSVSAEVKLRMADAEAKLAVFDAELNSIDGKTITAKADVDTRTAIIGVGALASAIAALGPVAVTAGALAVGGIGGLLPMLATAVVAAGTTALAFSGIGDAITAMNTEAVDPSAAHLKAMNQALAQLSATGRTFAHYIVDTIEPALQKLQNTGAAGMLPGVQAGLQALLGILPDVNTLVATTSQALGELAKEGGAALNDPFWTNFITFLNAQAQPTIQAFGEILGNLAEGFAGLTEAFDPVAQDMITGLQNLSQEFENWATTLDSNLGWQEFIDYIKTNGPLFVDTVKSIGDALGAIAEAAAPIGPVVLETIKALADALSYIVSLPVAGPTLVAIASGLGAVNLALKGFNAVKFSNIGVALAGIGTSGKEAETGARAAASGTEAMGESAEGASTGLTGAAEGAEAAGLGAEVMGEKSEESGDSVTEFSERLRSGKEIGETFGSSAEKAAEKTEKAGEAAATSATKVDKFTGAVSKGAKTLPIIGIAVIAASSLLDGFTNTTDEVEQGLKASGQAGEKFRDTLREQDAQLQQNKSTLPGWVNSLETGAENMLGVSRGTAAANAEFQKQLNEMTPLGQAQALAARAQGDYDDEVIRFGQNSPQAITALQNLHDAQARVQLQTQLANQSGMEYYQTLAKIAGQAGPVGDAARNLASGMDMAEVASMGATVSFDDAGHAIATLPDGKTITLKANGKDISTQIEGVAATVHNLPVSHQINVGVIDDQAMAEIAATGVAVKRLPNGTVVVKANTEAAKTALDQLGMQTQQTHTFDVQVPTGPPTNQISALQKAARRQQTMPVNANPASANVSVAGTQANARTPQTFDHNVNSAPANAGVSATDSAARAAQTFDHNVNSANANNGIGDTQRKAQQSQTFDYNANTSPATNALSALKRAWDNAKWFINVVANKIGFASGGIVSPMADGGVVGNASGNAYAATGTYLGHKLTKMSSGKAQMVSPDTWRVVGDRLDVPELFAPLDGSKRSLSLIATGARAFGYNLSKGADVYGQSTNDRITPPVQVNVPRVMAEAGSSSSKTVTNNVTVNNPIAERGSDSVQSELSRLADLGLFE